MDGMIGALRLVNLDDGPVPFTMRDGEAQRIGDAARLARASARDPAAKEATAETLLRRKRGDVVAVLWSEDRLHLQQVTAAEEILRVFSLITSGVAGRVVGSYEARADKGALSQLLPPALYSAYAERYAPWREWAGRMRVIGPHTIGDLVLLTVVDNLGPRQVEQRLGLRHGTALELLRKGLWQYAAMAGWVQDYPTLTVRG